MAEWLAWKRDGQLWLLPPGSGYSARRASVAVRQGPGQVERYLREIGGATAEELVARAEAAERRVAELEMPGNEEQEDLFGMLWTDYGSAEDDTLTPDAIALKGRLRAIVGADRMQARITAALAILRADCEACPTRVLGCEKGCATGEAREVLEREKA